MIIAIDIIKIVVLILTTFFTCMIISNKNKRISYIGTILVCFSTAVIQYINQGLVETLIFGQGFFIGFSNLLRDDSKKYLWLISAPLCLIGFLLLSNTSFQISIGITIITICMFEIVNCLSNKKESNNKIAKNKKNDNSEINEIVKIKKKKIYIIFTISCILAIIISAFFYNYNIIEKIEDVNGSAYLMNYTYTSSLPFNKEIKFESQDALATMISVFPIGLVIAILYAFKKEDEHSNFFMITSLVSIVEIILLITSKVSNIIPNYILSIGFAVLQIYMIVYIFANVKEKLFSMIKAAYISVFGFVFLMIVPFPSAISSIFNRGIPYMFFVLESFMVLNYTDKRFWRLASWVFTIICLFEFISGLIVKIL